jgi:hypothetical protein
LVPTVGFRILYVFLVLAHERRRVHFNVTEHPTADWAAAHFMQAFPWYTAPRYLLRDRDRVYGEAFRCTGGGHGDHRSARSSAPLVSRSPNDGIQSFFAGPSGFRNDSV